MDNGASSYRRFLDGDDYGMVELVRDYKDGLLLYLNSYTNDLNLAEDCVQDTFIKLATKMPKFKGKCTFKTWLYTIGKNLTLSKMRRIILERHANLDELKDISDEVDLEHEYLFEEQKITLYRSIRRLKNDYQQVLLLTYIEGFTRDEVGAIMHKTKKQVDNLLYNAKKSLKSELEKEQFQYEEL